ncbi:hypothetical protein CC80DRAFT_495437 [Byssothecium circinans]|uniref:ABC transmembrane type-1 domain-containing protein n=1 Tax=Byssothecium circinans TaxID=147558 RepID=A0A6A5TNI3_9PLEO|nr:hypothetical protein CC80DRAFT_495437 [Byssothecium circinans]
MTTLTTLLPLSLPLSLSLFLLPPKTSPLSLPAFYESLHESPRLPASPTPLDRARYTIHKAYYQYLITFSAYMLSTFERLLLDATMAFLVSVFVWGMMWIAPLLVRVVVGVVGGGGVVGGREFGGVLREGMEGADVSLVVVTTVFGKGAVGNATCTAFRA